MSTTIVSAQLQPTFQSQTGARDHSQSNSDYRPSVPQQSIFPSLSGQVLIDSLVANYAPDQTLGYGPARDSLYTYENTTDGSLIGVYSGFSIVLDPNLDASTDAANKGINAEHSWPQSMGAADEPQKSDLHHIYPARAEVNSARSNHPFAEINDSEADAWYRLTDSQSTIPSSSLDEWSERDNLHPSGLYAARFEPREDHKGNVARAMFYFYLIYQSAADAADPNFFGVQKDDLLRWSALDLVDAEEYDRDGYIATLQGNDNPFILDTTLARRVYGDPAPSENPGSGGSSMTDYWINEFHYDNSGTDVSEGVEVAGLAGTDLVGWTLEFYNGSGGIRYSTVALSGILPDQMSGFGTLWFSVSGIQNGSPDGLALIDGDGNVVQFLSYEGTIAAVDGSAQGVESEDVGVVEGSSTLAGYSLQLNGTGNRYTDFAWAGPDGSTEGTFNVGQVVTAKDRAWVNELHYDNAGNDRNEGLEIAGTSGLDLTGWTVIGYSGSNGLLYDQIALTGGLSVDVSGIGQAWFVFNDLQNGAADGIALIDADGGVVQFLSYEGTMTALDGPAAGLTSSDIGVAEGSTAKNRTLQLTGTGMFYADFTWTSSVYQTRGSVNGGQSFASSPGSASSPVGLAPNTFANLLEFRGAYPNPTTDRFTVSVEVGKPMDLAVSMYDLRGRLVMRDAEVWVSAGVHDIRLSSSGLGAGVYLYVIEGADARLRGRVVVAH